MGWFGAQVDYTQDKGMVHWNNVSSDLIPVIRTICPVLYKDSTAQEDGKAQMSSCTLCVTYYVTQRSRAMVCLAHTTVVIHSVHYWSVVCLSVS